MTIQEALTILEIQGEPTAKSVREAYLEMVKVWHPDRFPDDAKMKVRATRKTQEINSAYSVMQEHFRRPAASPVEPPPVPTTDSTTTGSQPQPGTGNPVGWCASPDQMVREFVGHDRYRVFPCKVGSQHSDESRLASASTFCFWGALGFSFLSNWFGSLMALCWLGFLLAAGLRVAYWVCLPFENPKRRPDAVIVTSQGVIILHKVLEDMETRCHRTETPIALSWQNLGSGRFAWEKGELTLLHVPSGVDGQPVTVKPNGFILSGRTRQTSYYRENVASMDELVEMLNQRFPLRA